MGPQISLADAVRKFAGPFALAILCLVLVDLFLLRTLATSETRNFWVDEVLSIWTARQTSSAGVLSAIWSGSEFSPPTYDLFLHAMFETFGFSRVVARLPSIIAILLSAIITAIIVWRRRGALSAALTLGLVLNSSLFDYAYQARPYALLMAVLSAALLLWSLSKAGGRNLWQAGALALLLFIAVSLHVYAIVALATFALMEALWSLVRRRLRPAIWLAFVVAGLASLAWLPLIAHLATFNSGDTSAPQFYAAPTLAHLVDDILTLVYQSKAFALFVLATVLLVGGATVLAHARRAQAPIEPQASDVPAHELDIMGFALLTTLPLGFALALFVTHAFSARYALPATIGVILLFVAALGRVPYSRAVGGLLFIALCILPLLREEPIDLCGRARDLIGEAPTSGPIAVTEGNLFLELMENTDPATRSRLVHLKRPRGVTDGDSSAEHQIARLAASIRPDLPLQEMPSFVAQNPEFTALSRLGAPTDGLGAWLIARQRVIGILGLRSNLMLSRMKVAPADLTASQ